MIAVVLSRPIHFNLVSWGIQWATHFDASHASIHVTGSGLLGGHRFVTEAVGRGVLIRLGSNWDADPHNEVRHTRLLRSEYDAQGRLAYQHAVVPLLGAQYDFRGIGAFAWRLILKRLFGVRTHTSETPGEAFCSELVARWLIALRRVLKIPGVDVLPPDETAPADLLPIMDEMGVFEEVSCVRWSSLIST